MLNIEREICQPRFLKTNIIEGLETLELKEQRKQLNNFSYKDCEINQLSFEAVLMDNVTFENCKIGQLFLSKSTINNVEFINCEINEIVFQACYIDIPSLQEFNKFKKVDNNHCVLEILKTSSLKKNVDLFSEYTRENIYKMSCDHNIFIHNDYIDNIGKSNLQLVVENIEIEIDNAMISIGCKMKSISEWNDWFQYSTEEYNTPRNTEKFNRIKYNYVLFRNEALQIIENLKKGLN